jgi:hypothetical protein
MIASCTVSNEQDADQTEKLSLDLDRYQLLIAGNPAAPIDWIANDGTVGILCGTPKLDTNNSILIQPSSAAIDTVRLPVRETSLRFMSGTVRMYVMLNCAVVVPDDSRHYHLFTGTLFSNVDTVNLGRIGAL